MEKPGEWMIERTIEDVLKEPIKKAKKELCEFINEIYINRYEDIKIKKIKKVKAVSPEMNDLELSCELENGKEIYILIKNYKSGFSGFEKLDDYLEIYRK